MYKTIPQLIGEITSLAALITINTKTDVFSDYSGHVNKLQISIHNKGWHSNSEADVYQEIDCDIHKYNKEKNIYTNLNKVKAELIKIARKGEVNFSKLPYEIETIEVKRYTLL